MDGKLKLQMCPVDEQRQSIKNNMKLKCNVWLGSESIIQGVMKGKRPHINLEFEQNLDFFKTYPSVISITVSGKAG